MSVVNIRLLKCFTSGFINPIQIGPLSRIDTLVNRCYSIIPSSISDIVLLTIYCDLNQGIHLISILDDYLQQQIPLIVAQYVVLGSYSDYLVVTKTLEQIRSKLIKYYKEHIPYYYLSYYSIMMKHNHSENQIRLRQYQNNTSGPIIPPTLPPVLSKSISDCGGSSSSAKRSRSSF
jgi:hypothetical protein